MKMVTGSACLALALLLAGMGMTGNFAAGDDEPMKDPQQHNHEAWQASPHGRSWHAEAERRYGPPGGNHLSAPEDGTSQETVRAGCKDLHLVRQQPAEPAKGR